MENFGLFRVLIILLNIKFYFHQFFLNFHNKQIYIDGVDKLPAEFEDKAIEYGIFDPELCAHSVARFANYKHVK